jgi:triosephosphate isomerase
MIRAEYAIIGHSETREPWRIIEKGVRMTAGFSPLIGNRDLLSATVLNEAEIGTDAPKSFRLALDAVVNQMVKKSLETGIVPILCVGETLEERKAKKTEEVVATQLRRGLEGLGADHVKQSIIAYEPVWAIGTGKTASPEQAQEVHAQIASDMKKRTNTEENVVPIIYGGSMKPENVAELVKQPDIHGGLIGGASLKPEVFMKLIVNGIEAVG